MSKGKKYVKKDAILPDPSDNVPAGFKVTQELKDMATDLLNDYGYLRANMPELSVIAGKVGRGGEDECQAIIDALINDSRVVTRNTHVI